MQEEVTNRTVNLAITTTKLTGRTVLNGIRAYLNHRAKVKTSKAQEIPHTSLKVMTVIQTMMITLVMMAVLTTAITVLKNPNILRHIMRNNIGRMNCDVMHKSRSGKKLKG